MAYCKNIYDIERYERLRDLAAEMISHKMAISKETVKNLFCNEDGYQTPKIDTRAAIFQDDKILLVLENDGLWSLPGGWVDVLETLHSNTVKEVYEEAGLDVKPTLLLQSTTSISITIHLWLIVYRRLLLCVKDCQVNLRRTVKRWSQLIFPWINFHQ